MKYRIHKRIAGRLLLVWLGLSVITATAVFFVELGHVNEHVMPAALNRAGKLSEQYRAYYHEPSGKALGIVGESIRTQLSRLHFVLAEIYSRNKDLLIREVIPEMRDRVGSLEAKEHDYMMTDKAVCRRFFDKGEIFLKIVVPILDSDDKTIIGYFEGICLVDPETMSEIRSRMITSVLMVFSVIFALTLAIYPIIINLNKDLLRLSGDLSDSNLGLLVVLGSAVAKRDSETNTHNYRVAIYAILLGEKVGLRYDQMHGLIKGAFLHDVGKIAIRDSVLHKPGSLTMEEFEEMKSHVRHGVEILEKYTWLEDALDIVGCHHEKYDGTGYPSGHFGENIPLKTRIFSIVDVFDALTSRRPYKDAFPFDDAIEHLKDGSGRHFDPKILEKFLLICGPLYNELKAADEAYLHSRMSSLVSNYFSTR
ncbi:MAG: HD-GYP domain-containing protein [Nitrospirae bacterium]|nr:HD-GYP domain-containing protein [Nitrospirota bacterium]